MASFCPDSNMLFLLCSGSVERPRRMVISTSNQLGDGQLRSVGFILLGVYMVYILPYTYSFNQWLS